MKNIIRGEQDAAALIKLIYDLKMRTRETICAQN